MELRLHVDGENPLILRVPTYYDAKTKKWLGAVHLPDSKKLIHGEGGDSYQLEQSFNKALSEAMSNPETSEEVFALFEVEVPE